VQRELPKKALPLANFLPISEAKNLAQFITDVEDGALAPSINARFRLVIFAPAIVTQIVGVPMGYTFTR
jgi:hypothetical protein